MCAITINVNCRVYYMCVINFINYMYLVLLKDTLIEKCTKKKEEIQLKNK
jgi:hypothetical protein